MAASRFGQVSTATAWELEGWEWGWESKAERRPEEVELSNYWCL
jgi:hypothetical protein